MWVNNTFIYLYSPTLFILFKVNDDDYIKSKCIPNVIRLQNDRPDNTISCTAPNLMPGSHLQPFVIFVASYLVILSHSVCDFGSVISVDFFCN